MYQPIISVDWPSNDQIIKKAKRLGYKYVNDIPQIQTPIESDSLEKLKTSLTVKASIPERIRCDEKRFLQSTIPKLDEHPAIRGLRPGTITEFVGLPDINKTGLCYNIIARYLLESADENVIFITTCGSYSALCVDDTIQRQPNYINQCTTDLLDRIKVFDSVDIEDFIISLAHIRSECSERNLQVGLLVIDGIFVHLKPLELRKKYFYKFGIMQKYLKELKELANRKQFPVVVTNNYTSHFDSEEIRFEPYLGERFAQFVNTRVHILSDTDLHWKVRLE